MGDNMEMAAKFEEGLKTGDFGRLTELVKEYAADDFAQEWPQSGERLTKDSSMRLNEAYAERSGTSPKFTYKRMIGGGERPEDFSCERLDVEQGTVTRLDESSDHEVELIFFEAGQQ